MAQVKNLKFRQDSQLLKIFLIGLLYLGGVVANEKQLYKISLHEPYNSVRNESAKLLNANSENPELVVEGNISIRHIATGQTDYDSVVMYIADKNGNRVRYQIKISKFMKFEISALALKVAAG